MELAHDPQVTRGNSVFLMFVHPYGMSVIVSSG
jgi:hypothetical protein